MEERQDNYRYFGARKFTHKNRDSVEDIANMLQEETITVKHPFLHKRLSSKQTRGTVIEQRLQKSDISTSLYQTLSRGITAATAKDFTSMRLRRLSRNDDTKSRTVTHAGMRLKTK